MSGTAFTRPIDDCVEKVNGEVAVGEDLPFQRKWWRFERATWIFFGLILLLDVAGVFGRGPVAKAQRRAPDGSISFPVSSLPASVEFALEPTGPGLRHLTLRVPGLTPVSVGVFVVP